MGRPFSWGLPMSNWELLDSCEYTGLKKYLGYDEETDNTLVKYVQDVDPILDRNKEAQVDSFDKRSEMWHAASVPNVVLMKWATEHGVQYWNPAHKDGVKRLLNDPEYRYLRVRNFII